jgi:hypothetical protein
MLCDLEINAYGYHFKNCIWIQRNFFRICKLCPKGRKTSSVVDLNSFFSDSDSDPQIIFFGFGFEFGYRFLD